MSLLSRVIGKGQRLLQGKFGCPFMRSIGFRSFLAQYSLYLADK
jgi:hypothetical protein